MSRPFYLQQAPPPPPQEFVLQSNNGGHTYSPHGSIGAVVGVLIMVVILAAVAVVIGRLCSRKSIMGYGHYDLESWAETKCSSCIDGRINVAPPCRPNVSTETPPQQTTTESHHQEEQSTVQNSAPEHV